MTFAESSEEPRGSDERTRSHDRVPHAAHSLTRYLDQSASSLRWTLVEGEVDLHHFQLLASASIGGSGFRLQAHIVGASHLLRMEWEAGAVYHEVVACTELPESLKQASTARLAAPPEGGVVERRLSGGHVLRFESEIVDGASAAPRLNALSEAIERAASRRGRELGLRFEFPRAKHDVDRATRSTSGPLTLVRAFLSPASDRVAIETAHSYPNEARVVFTRTSVETGCVGGAFW